MQAPIFRTTSPYSYLQEELRSDPWKMLVACVLLNQTHYKNVRKVIWDLFETWPTPEAMASADVAALTEHIRICGLYNRRAASLVKMAAQIVADPDWRQHPDRLFGVGKYAMDSWRIFVLGDMAVTPADKELKRYLEWARQE